MSGLSRLGFGNALAAFAKATPKVFANGRRAKGAVVPPTEDTSMLVAARSTEARFFYLL